MSTSHLERRLIFSSAWSPSPSPNRLRLERVSDGTRIDVAGLQASGLGAALRAARRPLEERHFLDALEGSNQEKRQLLKLLRAHEVLRPFHAAHPPRLHGDPQAGALVQSVLRQGGWALPDLEARSGMTAPVRPRRRGGPVMLGAWANGVVAFSQATGVCGRCILLRRLARTGTGGVDQFRLLHSRRMALPRIQQRAVLTELLMELQRGLLEAGECIVVGRGQRATRGRALAHPDCERCYTPPRRSAAAATQALKQALARDRAHPPEKGARDLYLDPVLGPAEIEEERGPRGKYPLDTPFIWGSVFVTRVREPRAICLSTHGGIYASTESLELSRTVALSEGVERLAARSVRGDVWNRTSAQPRAASLRSLFGWTSAADEKRERAFCHGVDLVDGKPCLVPLESVAVGWPRALYPQAAHREEFYSGTASHVTLAQAVVNASVEILKRDAFMISWYRRRALPRLTWPRKPSALARQRTAYLKAQGVELELFDLTLELPMPMVLLRLTARRTVGNWPRGGAMLVPAGGFDAMHALEDALRLAAGQWVSIALNPDPLKDPLNPRAVREMTQSARFWPLVARYLDPAHAPDHAFLGGAGEVRFESLVSPPVHSVDDRMRLLRRWLKERGMRWLAVRLTDGAAHAAGFEVAKVIIPGLVALSPSRETTNLRIPRMMRPWSWSTTQRPNPHPHPLY